MSEQESEFLNMFRRLNSDGKEYAMDFMRMFSSEPANIPRPPAKTSAFPLKLVVGGR